MTSVSDVQRWLPAPLPLVRIEAISASDWEDLRAGLEGLGFEVCYRHGGNSVSEVCLVESGCLPAMAADSPFLVIGREGSVGTAARAIQCGASGYFAIPCEWLSLGVAILTCASRSRALDSLKQRITELTASLDGAHKVNTMVGILMERYHLSRAAAYGRLRQIAKTEGHTIVELADRLTATTETLNRTLKAIEGI